MQSSASRWTSVGRLPGVENVAEDSRYSKSEEVEKTGLDNDKKGTSQVRTARHGPYRTEPVNRERLGAYTLRKGTIQTH